MHALRIDDELWSAAMAKAKSEGRTLTQVINDSLAAYVAGPERIEIIPLEPKKITRGRPAKAERVIAVPPGVDMGGLPEAAPKPAARQRCPHPGTRVIGGWCKHCDVVVGQGGFLPG